MERTDEKLKSMKLYKEGGKYYLHAVYGYKINGEEHEIDIPKIEMNFENYPILTLGDRVEYCRLSSQDCCLHRILAVGDNDVAYTDRILKKKMTVEDIEKELGYSVEIVHTNRPKVGITYTCADCKHLNSYGTSPCTECRDHDKYVRNENI